jgi:hypothetical protein
MTFTRIFAASNRWTFFWTQEKISSPVVGFFKGGRKGSSEAAIFGGGRAAPRFACKKTGVTSARARTRGQNPLVHRRIDLRRNGGDLRHT